MSISVLWENVKKIWEKGRGYSLIELSDTERGKVAIFQKGDSKAYVYVTDRQVSVQTVRRVINEANERGCSEIMIATLDKVTTQAEEVGKENNVEFIHKGAPLIYIFDHWLVPEHRVLPPDEAKRIIEKYAGGNPELLPKISVRDPAVRILRAKPGDIIEIRRRVPPKEELIKRYGKKFGEKAYEILRELTPAGEEISYRIVVEETEQYLY